MTGELHFPTHPRRDRTRLGYRTWIRRSWDGVEIGRLIVCRQTLDPRAPVRLEAEVELGKLLPADVRVFLVLDDGIWAERPSPRAIRMLSTRSYRNGTFIFEASVQPALVRERAHALVVVCPARPADDRGELAPVAQPFSLAPRRSGEATM